MIEYFATEDAYRPGALTEKLDKLRQISSQASQDPRMIEWTVEEMGIDEEQAESWFARAWWGVAAGELIRAYLFDEALIDEALDLLVPPDWSPIEETLENSGAIVVGSHLGPPNYLMNILMRRFKGIFILNNTDDMPDWLPGHCENMHNPKIASDRSLIMLGAAAHIRKGGLFFGTPDGGQSDKKIVIEHPHGKRNISLGIPALSRLLKVKIFPLEALWKENTIVVKSFTAPSPASDLDSETWYEEWAAGYWRNIRTTIQETPENNRRLKWHLRQQRLFV